MADGEGDDVNVLKAAVRTVVLTPVQRLRKRAKRVQRRRDERALAAHAGLIVQSGPFAGMSLQGARSPIGGKLLGTHEMELAPVLERLCHSDLQHVVNVGAADGFYAVGMLRRLTTARATAFEMVTSYHSAIDELARSNGVRDRLAVRGACDVEALASAIAANERTLVIIDVEGAERDLLDPARVPRLRDAWILVELHDFVDPQISTIVRQRFHDTHRVTGYRAAPRTIHDVPAVDGMSARALLRLADEGRPALMEWYWMEPARIARAD